MKGNWAPSPRSRRKKTHRPLFFYGEIAITGLVGLGKRVAAPAEITDITLFVFVERAISGTGQWHAVLGYGHLLALDGYPVIGAGGVGQDIEPGIQAHEDRVAAIGLDLDLAVVGGGEYARLGSSTESFFVLAVADSEF